MLRADVLRLARRPTPFPRRRSASRRGRHAATGADRLERAAVSPGPADRAEVHRLHQSDGFSSRCPSTAARSSWRAGHNRGTLFS